MSGIKEGPAGSPSAGEPVYLVVGKIRRPHGVSGEALVEIVTDFPGRLQPKTTLYAGKNHQPLVIQSRRTHKDGLLIAFEGITTPEEIGRFRNQFLYLHAQAGYQPQKGEYFHYQVMGLTVRDENGCELGTLTEIIETGANDVFVITSKNKKEMLLPVIPDVILNVSLPNSTITVHVPDGIDAEEINNV